VLAPANTPNLLPLPTIEDDVTKMFALAVVPDVFKLNEPVANMLDPAALDENDVTVANPFPPATLSVSAELKSRIIRSLSRSSNVPVSYFIVISRLGVSTRDAGKHPAVGTIM
jgi:hypothetical protein